MSSSAVAQLEATHDSFRGRIIDAGQAAGATDDEFAARLDATLAEYIASGDVRGVWLRVPLACAAFVPLAAARGFEFHHADSRTGDAQTSAALASDRVPASYVMMTLWLPSSPSTLPANASHYIGVGGFVVNASNELLVIREASGPRRLRAVWKLPGGAADVGENLPDAAVREVLEETGVRAEFESLACFRQQHGHAFGKSDLYFVCVLRPLSSDLVPQASEIAEARWMPLDEFLALPVYQEGLWGEMMRHAAAVAAGRAPALNARDLPHLYRPGVNMMFSASASRL